MLRVTCFLNITISIAYLNSPINEFCWAFFIGLTVLKNDADIKKCFMTATLGQNMYCNSVKCVVF